MRYHGTTFFAVFILNLGISQAIALAAQDVPAVSTGDIRFYVDYAGFRGKNGRTYQEFYLMLYADQLRYVWKGAKQLGIFQVTARLENAAGKEVSRQSWTTEASIIQDSTGLNSLAIYDQWAEQLDPGQYLLSVAVADQNESNQGEAQFSLRVPEMAPREFDASQIEFVAHADPEITRTHFEKGGRTIIPNPSRRYGVLNPVLYFYYELYNLPEFTAAAFMVTYSLQDKNGRVVKMYPPKRIRQPGSTASLVHGVDVSTVPSGIYELSAQIADSLHGERLRFSRQFEVIQMDYLSGPTLTKEHSEQAGRLLKYCATPEEYQFYQRLNASGKAQFLIRFWRDRDPTPATEQNEYLEQVQQRYRYANEHFGWSTEEGWANERGRVLIQYGMPDEISRHHSEAETVPYEIWIYSQERRYDFVFADLQSNGHFVLLHSSKEGEVHNTDWRRLIKRL